MDGKEARAALRIMTTARRVDDISRLMNATPTKSFDVGDVIGSCGAMNGKLRRHTLWSLSADLPATSTLEDQIDWLLNFLDAHLRELEILRPDCSLDLFCFYSSENGQGSIELSSATMKRLGNLGVDLIVDLYLSEPDG
jgi:hypothetical protein